MEKEPTDRGLLDRPFFGSISNSIHSLFYPTTTMHSPAPNIPGVVSAVSSFTEYLNELKATSIDDICELDKTTNALFARKDASIHALGVGGGAALAGCMAAQPQGGNLTVAQAMAAGRRLQNHLAMSLRTLGTQNGKPRSPGRAYLRWTIAARQPGGCGGYGAPQQRTGETTTEPHGGGWGGGSQEPSRERTTAGIEPEDDGGDGT
jgi:hypothetical protein